jgi:hypothetical protein
LSLSNTIAEAITALLVVQWNLAAPLAAVNIHFDTGWLDRKWLTFSSPAPQIISSGPMTSPIRFFSPDVNPGTGTPDAGHHLLSYGIYVVNIWVRIPAGEETQTAWDIVELLRNEVVRILNENCITVPGGVTFVIPLDYGRALHELNVTPRVLRFEITVQANYQT